MYNALKILGKEVQFVNVKGENHGIMEYQKRLKWNKTIYAWFDKYLKEDSSLWNKMYPETNLEK
jgi:dipeptidyl aminopeptidase/acylaminoacyl peptidase